MYTAVSFDSKVPMFPAAEQLALIKDNPQAIVLMESSKTLEEWNVNRHVLRALWRANIKYYVMLMGYIDNVVFQATHKNWKK